MYDLSHFFTVAGTVRKQRIERAWALLKEELEDATKNRALVFEECHCFERGSFVDHLDAMRQQDPDAYTAFVEELRKSPFPIDLTVNEDDVYTLKPIPPKISGSDSEPRP